MSEINVSDVKRNVTRFVEPLPLIQLIRSTLRYSKVNPVIPNLVTNE